MPTILIAEDEPRIVSFLEKGLRRLGFATEVAEDGCIALEKITQKPFDLLILDLGLPKNDGLEVLQALRKNNSSLPVLVVTARSLGRNELKTLESSGVEVINKPFRMKYLLHKVKTLLGLTSE